MNATLKFLPQTLKQTGTVGQLLLWAQENPKQLRNTNVTQMARTFCMTHSIQLLTAKAQLQKMVNVQMLTKFGGKRRASFFINYFHKDIPGYILENAPEEDKRRIAMLKEGLSENQHIEADGVVVTENTRNSEDKCSEVTITNEETEQTNQVATVYNEVPAEEEISSSDMSEEKTTSVPIKVVDTERGLSISITLNLNINK